MTLTNTQSDRLFAAAILALVCGLVCVNAAGAHADAPPAVFAISEDAPGFGVPGESAAAGLFGSGRLFVPLNMVQGDSLPTELLAGTASSPGIGMFLSAPPSSGSSGPTASPQLAYGMLDNLALSRSAGSAAVDEHGLTLKGQLFFGGAAAGAASGDAIDQALSYSGRNFSATATYVQVGRSFAASPSLTSALISADQTSRDALKALGGQTGQTGQSLALSLGNARTGVLALSVQRATNGTLHQNTQDTSLGYNWGDAKRFQFAVLDSSLVDNSARTRLTTQSYSINHAISRILSLSVNHSAQATTGAVHSSNVNDQIDVSAHSKDGSSADLLALSSYNNLGGFDRVVGLSEKRTAFGLTLGVQAQNETKRVASGTSSYSVKTLGYSVDRQLSKLFSVDTCWVQTIDSSKPAGHQRSVVASAKFLLTPTPNMSIQDLYTTTAGVDNSAVNTSLAVAGAKLTAAVASSSSPTAASTHTSKVALDTSLSKLKNIVQLASISNFHLEMDQTQTDAWGVDGPEEFGAAGVKLAGALAAFKGSQWSYAFVARSQMAAASSPAGTVPVASSRMFDLSVPVRRMTLSIYDHDQLPQADGTYKNIKERRFSISAPLLRAAVGGLEYSECTDATCARLTRRRAYGFSLTGSSGPLKNLQIEVTRQMESELGNGDDNGMVYNIDYKFLPPGAAEAVSLSCNVATNTFDNRTGATDNVAATVHCDYSVHY